MKGSYLTVTYRHGRPLAAYLYLPRRAGDTSHRTEQYAPGLLVDFHSDGRPIGIEITTPARVTLDALNKILLDLRLPPATQEDLSPILAA